MKHVAGKLKLIDDQIQTNSLITRVAFSMGNGKSFPPWKS